MSAERDLTDKQRAFLANLIPCQGNIRKAMTAAGYSADANATSLVKALRPEIQELGEVALASGMVQAACSLTGVLDDPAAVGAREKIAAAKEILDRVGLGKVETQKIELSTPNGVFILPPKHES